MDLQVWLADIRAAKGHAAVMGILNVTPDSFSDGGRLNSLQTLCEAARQMIVDGADILDIGGESTRPGADPVSLDEELQRVIPAIEAIREFSDIPISIDTYKPEVMATALSAGANIINDVNALQAEGALEVAAEFACPVCLMHKKGIPKTMQKSINYDDVVEDVIDFLRCRAKMCETFGIKKSQILLDPGFGFGKELEHNVALFKALNRFVNLEYPLLVGVSRKRMIAQLLEYGAQIPASERMVGSLAAAVLASLNGADLVRVHDVKQTVEVLKIAHVLRG